MSIVDPASPVPPIPAPPVVLPAVPPETPAPPVPGPPTPSDPPKVNPWEDPEAAKAEIEKLRRENAASRTNAKEAAATEARNELAQSIGKILNPDANEPLDPAGLTEALTAEKATTRQARVELAVFRAAAEGNGDPAALLDSTSFLKSLEGIDPNDGAAIQAAIASAVETNPRLGVATEPRLPAPNPAQGSSANGAPGIEAQIADATKAGNHALVISLKRQLAAMKP